MQTLGDLIVKASLANLGDEDLRIIVSQANEYCIQRLKAHMVGLAGNLDLLRGHLAKDSDGNTGCEGVSVLTRHDQGLWDAIRPGKGCCYTRSARY